jgi:SulP family sulfate permease
VVHDSIVGSDCYIGIGAIVVGVEIPRGRYVPHGAIIDTHDKADGLQPVRDEHREFNEDVVDVNRGLAAAYRKDAWQIKAPGGSRRIAATADRF